MILAYLLRVSVCTLLFFAIYRFLLVKLTFFNLNRAYLLLMLAACFIIPAITVEKYHEVTASSQKIPSKVSYSRGGTVEKDYVDKDRTENSEINWNRLLLYAYYTISLILIFRMFLILLKIRRQLHKNTVAVDGEVILVNTHAEIKNCSFFNRIIVDVSLQPHEKDLVIKHESVHVQQLHALDKMLVNLVTAILWFNPVVYFWRNAIDHNHEFLADEQTAKTADKKVYASLLLNLAMPSKNIAINSFSKLPLKNRIMMMYKEPNLKYQKLTYLTVIPVLLICCMAFINRKEIIVAKIPDTGVASPDAPKKPNVYAMNYLNGGIKVNPKAVSAFKEVEPTLIIDAGHGGKDDASTALDGQKEKDLNLRAVKIIEEEAEKRGIKVILTRNDDQFLSLRDRLPEQEATAFISIHHNTASSETAIPFDGIEVYVSKLNPKIKINEELGIGILSKLKGQKDLAVKEALKDGNLLLLRESKVPAVLIEMGNISDAKTLSYLNEEKNIRKISNLILDGFVQFSKRGC